MISIRRALVSVSDKRGLAALARALGARGVEIVSTGATARALREAGAEATDVAAATGAPEILDGRVKTLHPKIHAAILADGKNPAHLQTLRDMSLQKFDLVAVNFYPFERAASRGVALAELVESIDIGGPCMVRAAAKNMESVVCVTDPDDYGALAAEMERNDGAVSPPFARRLAAKAFAATARYEAAIANEIAARAESDSAPDGDEEPPLPAERFLALRRERALRYGENPHQRAGLYRVAGESAADAETLQGGALSYNNILDAHAARTLLADLCALREGAAAVIIKHNNPCGAALAPDLAEAFARARAADETSAFGGVVALGGAVDGRLARALVESFFVSRARAGVRRGGAGDSGFEAANAGFAVAAGWGASGARGGVSRRRRGMGAFCNLPTGRRTRFPPPRRLGARPMPASGAICASRGRWRGGLNPTRSCSPKTGRRSASAPGR